MRAMANSGFLTFSEALRSNCDGGGLEAVRRELWEKYKREIKAGKWLLNAWVGQLLNLGQNESCTTKSA